MHAQAPAHPGAYAVVLLLFLCTSVGVGVLIGTTARNQSMSSMLSMLVFFPTVLLTGIMFPVRMLPESFRWVSRIFPGTHAMQAFAGFAYHRRTDFNPALALWILIGMGLAAFGLAIWRFGSIRQSERA